MSANKLSSRLIFKVATAIDNIGPRLFETHLDTMISGNDGSQKAKAADSKLFESVLSVIAANSGITKDQLISESGDSFDFLCFLLKVDFGWTYRKICKHSKRKSHTHILKKVNTLLHLNESKSSDRVQLTELKKLRKKIQPIIKEFNK
jgi:hypothetical protein